MHLNDTDACDGLIEKWDGQKLPGYDGGKPLQVRYKGMDQKTLGILASMQPVLWVYGFPKGMTEEEFRAEFLLGMEVNKIDFFDQKLFAFVHCNDTKQCLKYINKWDTKMMSSSKSPLQVRFKSINSKPQSHNNNNNNNNSNFYNNQGGMGDMQNNMYNQTFQNNGYYGNGMQLNNRPQNNYQQMNHQQMNMGYNQYNNNRNNQMIHNNQFINGGNRQWNQNMNQQMGIQSFDNFNRRQNNFNRPR